MIVRKPIRKTKSDSHKLIVFSGLPGSGKTSECWVLVAMDGSAELISRDIIRRELIRTFIGIAGIEIKEDFLTEEIIRQAAKAMQTGGTVVVDAMNLHEHDKIRWETMAWAFGYDLEWLPMRTPVEVCIQRDAARPESVGRERILKYAKEAQLV